MISVLYSGNKDYFEGLLLSALSVVENTSEAVHFYVLTMDLSDENPKFKAFTDRQISILNEAIKKHNADNFAEKIDVTKEYRAHLEDGKNHKNGYTPYAAIRLLFDLCENVDFPSRLVYLDIDTMCVGDISELAKIDLGGKDVAMVRDYMAKWWKYYNYCNSGVMLIDFDKIREKGIFEKCRKLVYRKKLMMPDQSAINRYATKKFLPRKFNEQRKIRKDTVVKHFCEGIRFFLPFWLIVYNIKPWEREKIHKILGDIFDKYYAEIDELKEKWGG